MVVGRVGRTMRESTGQRAFDIANAAFLICVSIITVYPMLHSAASSLSDPSRLMSHLGVLVWPEGFSLASYKAVFRNPMILSGYRNTLFVVSVGLIINVLLTSMGAYFLSRKNIMLKKAVMFVVVFTMFFSGGMIPFYLTIKGLHIDNSLWSLILPVSINTFNLIVMRTAFLSLPDSLEESAKIDGAGHFTILFKIVLPLSMATVAVMILYYGVFHWNAWFNAMLFLRKRDLYPLQLVLREILVQNDTNAMSFNSSTGEEEYVSDTIKYAVIIVATVPILALYPFLQRYFVKGLMIGSIKG